MKITIPKDIFKKVPARAWVIIAIGLTIFLVLMGATFYKYGGIFIHRTNIEKAK